MSAVARRYAKALFELAKESNVLAPAADELKRLAEALSDPVISPVLGSPLLTIKKQSDLLDAIVRDLNLSDLLSRFLRLLGDHGRIRQLAAIETDYQHLLDAELGRVRIHIRAASPLTSQQQADIVDRFAQITGKQVLPQISVEPGLLGGILVEVGGKVYDGSVHNQLERLAAQLSGMATH